MSEQQRIPPKRLMVVMIAIAILAIAALSLPSELLGIVLGGENKSGRHHAVKDNAYLPGDAAESRRGHIFVDTGGSSWVESHSPRRNHSQSTSMDADQKSEGRIRISFRLHDPDTVPYPQQYLSVHGYMCPGSEPLPPTMSGRTILNFTTTISTDLNILFIGDSISQQFAQGFYSSVLDGERHIGSHYITRSFINGQVFQNSGLHVCSSLVAPARGGGVSAYWRVLELMSKQNSVEWYVNCKRDKTWWAREGERLATHRYPFPTDGPNELIKVNTNKNNGATTWYRKIFNDTGYRNVTETQSPEQQYYSVGGFDCCVLRIQHGWMELHEITRERVVEEIELCNKVVGASTVIISTLPLNNNVITSSDWEGIISLNSVIRDIARNWKPVENGLQWVLVQEFGNFTNQILWRNAEVNAPSTPVQFGRLFCSSQISSSFKNEAHWI